jgi:serine/threonine-protein kinase
MLSRLTLGRHLFLYFLAALIVFAVGAVLLSRFAWWYKPVYHLLALFLYGLTAVIIRIYHTPGVLLNTTIHGTSTGEKPPEPKPVRPGKGVEEQEHIGRYHIEGLIGKGSMGEVYKARDPRINRAVAIKTIRHDLSLLSGTSIKERFFQEAHTIGALSHPNIITIYDMGEEEGLTFLVMELLKGKTLKSAIPAKGITDHEKIKCWMKHICSGLSYAHKKGIIHRDIKPANIMLVDNGASAKIMDFGISKIRDSNLTETGQALGTPSYMAPEQIMGKGISHRVDIFSLGVMLYEMFCGHRPFKGDSLTAITYSIVNEPHKSITELTSNLPGKMESIFDRCLAKDASYRYNDAEDLYRALETVL